jgi:hypothetical protein
MSDWPAKRVRLSLAFGTLPSTQGGVRLAPSCASTNQEQDMADDDKIQPGGQDRTRININEGYEVQDWSKKFGVSPFRP